MPTMLEIPRSLYERAEKAASAAGLSLEDFVAEAIHSRLGELASHPKGNRVRLPLVGSRHPGSRMLDAETIAELLEADDLPA